MTRPPTREDYAQAQFKKFVLRLVTIAYVFGLAVGCLLTIWLWEC